MRHFLISALFLSLVVGCSNVKIGPHRIDVQQGNALDQENVARLKTGLSRSQVRFLLGTPLVVDPFRTNRWDYVYVYYKAGKLAEKKRITLFFEGDTLARIEGDLPAVEPAVQAEPKAETPALPAIAEAKPTAAPAPAPVVTTAATTSIVSPLPSPKNAPAYVDPRPPAELSLQPETDVAKIQPDVIPPFSGTDPVTAGDAPVLKSLNEWANAWARRDNAAYFAAYDARFVPQGGGSRADWETRKRQSLNAAKSIEIKIDSPSVERADDGTATVRFNQYFRSDRYRDAVVKRLRMVEREGRWLIVEEEVLSILRDTQP
ncbi:MAG TPA: outer membrane protein assembly factor BamE [Thiobacillus sp.]|nr:outer membrane protein assembly factor BamE [Thiobacillus sp.]